MGQELDQAPMSRLRGGDIPRCQDEGLRGLSRVNRSYAPRGTKRRQSCNSEIEHSDLTERLQAVVEMSLRAREPRAATAALLTCTPAWRTVAGGSDVTGRLARSIVKSWTHICGCSGERQRCGGQLPFFSGEPAPSVVSGCGTPAGRARLQADNRIGAHEHLVMAVMRSYGRRKTSPGPPVLWPFGHSACQGRQVAGVQRTEGPLLARRWIEPTRASCRVRFNNCRPRALGPKS